MNLSTKTTNELIDIALKTTCINEMNFLKNYPYMNVRRALARNANACKEVLYSLYNDPVQNVSFVASQHPNLYCNEKDFKELRACVLCEKDEKDLNCTNCIETQGHKF